MKKLGLPMAVSLLAPALGGAEVETMHGYEIADPFRHFETDEGADPWIAKEHEATEAHLAATGVDRGAIEARLDELSQISSLGRLRLAGERIFYVKREGTQEQPSLYVRYRDEEKKLVDPGAMDAGGKTAMDWFHPSPSGEKVAYGISKDGTELSVLHLLDTRTGEAIGERIPNARAASVAWLPDESGFYYTRYPEGDRYNRRVYFHRIGEDPAKDRHVFGEGAIDKTDWPSVKLAEDEKTLIIEVSRGWSASDVWLLGPGDEAPRRILDGVELGALFGSPVLRDGKLLLLTNHEAPRYKVVEVDPRRPDPAQWKTVIPEGDWPIEGMRVVRDSLALLRLEKAVSKVAVYDLKEPEKAPRAIELPGLGSIDALEGRAKGDRFLLGYTSFVEPSKVLELPLGETEPKTLMSVEAPGMEDVVVEQIDFPSYDGTWVPMFVLYKEGLEKKGQNPTLLTGYGGFNVSYTPGFSSTVLYWLERGGVYAVANLRGGAEFGEAWHEAGKLENKHQVFRDFEYAMRHLIREGFTRPEKLAITGGSNGGLLMGAMMTQAPELFQAAVGRVGLYDMIRFQHFLIAELWVDEYGSSANSDQVGYLYGYSPYHQVLPGVRYPAFFGLTAKSDTRVHWNHTVKFVAALKEAQAGDAPILLHVEERAGHGQGKGRSDRVKETALWMQFILSQVGEKSLAAPAKR